MDAPARPPFRGPEVPASGAGRGKIVDFLCLELKLILELDGGVHELRLVEDAERDARLTEAGFLVLRFENSAFQRNPNILLDAIRLRAAEMRT